MKCFILLATLLSTQAFPDHFSPSSSYSVGGAPPLGSFGAESRSQSTQAQYKAPSFGRQGGNDLDIGGSELDEISTDPLAMLEKAVPGIPGEDYPIYAEAPDTGFSCEGQIDGGYYADPEAQCQVFHICSNDGSGGIAKYSFLCPNGTIFNQQYFICDWWFNFDCAEAEALAQIRNEELLAAREEATAAAASRGFNVDSSAAGSQNVPVQASYGRPQTSYGSPSQQVSDSVIVEDRLATYGKKK